MIRTWTKIKSYLSLSPASFKEESLDIVRSGASCEKEIVPGASEVGRAGAVSEYAHRRVLLCGGRDHEGGVRSDCLAYDPKTNEWEEYNSLLSAREEAAAATVRPEAGADGDMFIAGGFVDGERTATVERLPKDRESGWRSSTSLPEPRSRFCAVAVSDNTVAVVGGESGESGTTDERKATADLKTYSLSDDDWTTQPGMAQARKDHACLMVEIDGDKGILVPRELVNQGFSTYGSRPENT